MKVKTSVTLSEELLRAITSEAREQNRSAFIEEATWRYLRLRKRLERDRTELDLINANAQALNEEAAEVLGYQDLE
jgi:metal-responsive CopG/Arc/MetJ family transcriptional regulator